MGATYVQITRAEWEEWLDTLPFKWKLKDGSVGLYHLMLSDNVAIEVRSTVSSREEVMDRAQASIQMRMISLVTGQVLNKKAQEQSRFHRTKNWRNTLAQALQRFKQVYEQSQSFYEAIARIADRDAYREEWIRKIEGVPGWETNRFLQDIHDRLAKRNILTEKQEAAVDRAVANAPSARQTPSGPPPRQMGPAQPAHPGRFRVPTHWRDVIPEPPQDEADEAHYGPALQRTLQVVRALWVVVRNAGDDSDLKLVERVGRELARPGPFGALVEDDDLQRLHRIMKEHEEALAEYLANPPRRTAQTLAARWLTR